MRRRDMEALEALRKGADREWIAALGQALYGEKWQRPLGQALGVSSGYVHRLMTDGPGRLDVSEKLRVRVADLAAREAPDRLAAWQYVSALLAEAQDRFGRSDLS